jgi:hypothetical protein
MKFKIIAPLLICTLTFISCASLEDGPFVGFKLDIGNLTNEEYNNAKLLIGGMQNGTFISTESYDLPTIIIRPNESFSQVVAFDENRWKPDLSLIAEISDRAYFAFQFENSEQILLYDSFNSSELINFSIIENAIVKRDYGGDLIITLDEGQTARAIFHEDDY